MTTLPNHDMDLSNGDVSGAEYSGGLSNGDVLHGVVFIYSPKYPMDSHVQHICLERIMLDSTPPDTAAVTCGLNINPCPTTATSMPTKDTRTDMQMEWSIFNDAESGTISYQVDLLNGSATALGFSFVYTTLQATLTGSSSLPSGIYQARVTATNRANLSSHTTVQWMLDKDEPLNANTSVCLDHSVGATGIHRPDGFLYLNSTTGVSVCWEPNTFMDLHSGLKYFNVRL